jgi:hypothetical protein
MAFLLFETKIFHRESDETMRKFAIGLGSVVSASSLYLNWRNLYRDHIVTFTATSGHIEGIYIPSNRIASMVLGYSSRHPDEKLEDEVLAEFLRTRLPAPCFVTKTRLHPFATSLSKAVESAKRSLTATGASEASVVESLTRPFISESRYILDAEDLKVVTDRSLPLLERRRMLKLRCMSELPAEVTSSD